MVKSHFAAARKAAAVELKSLNEAREEETSLVYFYTGLGMDRREAVRRAHEDVGTRLAVRLRGVWDNPKPVHW